MRVGWTKSGSSGRTYKDPPAPRRFHLSLADQLELRRAGLLSNGQAVALVSPARTATKPSNRLWWALSATAWEAAGPTALLDVWDYDTAGRCVGSSPARFTKDRLTLERMQDDAYQCRSGPVTASRFAIVTTVVS